MSRPTRVLINTTSLLHNLSVVKRTAPDSKVIAMVKANAYGCGIASVVPSLEGQVEAFGVACLEEALAIKALGVCTPSILFQGVFSAEELPIVAENQFQCVIHNPQQLQWLLSNPLSQPITVWVKVNTGMYRLGFSTTEAYSVLSALADCAWVNDKVGLMTHFANADEPGNPVNEQQIRAFTTLKVPQINVMRSMGNSAAILALEESHNDVVRPGIMLYGVSPFAHKTGQELGLKPVMNFTSAISAIHHYPAGASLGYGGIWKTRKPSVIGVVAVGYGDGYPRHVEENTPVWIKGQLAAIVGRISMDMLTVDLTDIESVQLGDTVELWGEHLPVEKIALSAKTIAYELLCQLSPRVRQDS